MRKKILLCISLLAVCILCSCGSENNSTEVDSTATTATDSNAEQENAAEENIACTGNGSAWKSALFEYPAIDYNNELALVAAEMSDKAEDMTGLGIKNLFSQYGISNCETYNYENRGTAAFAIGYDTLSIKGDDTIILIIVARGTKRVEEMIGDALKGEPQDFLDQTVCGNVYDFEEQIWDGIDDYLEKHPELMNAERLKILITGHSLGGAAANMTAARFTKFAEWGGWWSDLADKDDIYAYTFGAITVLTTEENVSDGYENIHNVYNFYDTFGPNDSIKLDGVIVASSPNAKFGHTELYSWDEEHGSKEGETSFAANHTNYKKALEKFREDQTVIDLACRRSDSELSQKETGAGKPAEDEWGSEFIKGTWKNVGTTTFGDAEMIQESVGDFVIEGSWLSVGSSGFGQAQPGATVIFDGQHCNFYSPYDAYAFYEKDGEWKLECTNCLWADTVSFTVQIIDENSMHVSYGTNITELERLVE